ncbi:hypothetical protein ACFWB0_06085 [Rhodococcus sp. NPDC060086]|uniref:hypothetical protein n=1 Tax=Rhodococcus sp. NPDC060086 TaxID=3347055 RepID=UPI003665123A
MMKPLSRVAGWCGACAHTNCQFAIRTTPYVQGEALNLNDSLLASIIHYDILERCKAGEDYRARTLCLCRTLPLNEHQVPEPWTGHLDRARLVVISSNLSIDPVEVYPRWGEDLTESIRDGIYSPLPDGGWSGAVRFRAAARQRAFELIPDATPGIDYALTEVVHCKCEREFGVAQARHTCATRYLPKVLEAAEE